MAFSSFGGLVFRGFSLSGIGLGLRVYHHKKEKGALGLHHTRTSKTTEFGDVYKGKSNKKSQVAKSKRKIFPLYIASEGKSNRNIKPLCITSEGLRFRVEGSSSSL